jgi:NADH:ubiquinone oxidoreductase subunit F (NADH-binding)
MNSGCKNCTKRYSGCHSHCEIYAKFKQELKAMKDRDRLEHMCDSYSHLNTIRDLNRRRSYS